MKSLAFLFSLLVFISGCVSQSADIDSVLKADTKVEHFLSIFGDIATSIKIQSKEEVNIEKSVASTDGKTNVTFKIVPKNYPERASEIGYVIIEGGKITKYSDSIEVVQQYSSASDFAKRWVSNLIKTTTKQVEERAVTALKCSQAAITIEEVYIDTLRKTTTAVVRNTGQTDGLQIIFAQLFNRTGGNFSAQSLLITLNEGEASTLTFSANIPVCPQDFSKVIASTNCGGVSAEFSGSPKCA